MMHAPTASSKPCNRSIRMPDPTTNDPLVTNAATHGALSMPGGRVAVVWDVGRDDDGRRMLCLEWTERDGPPVEPPSRKGFGSTLLERVLPAQCSAEVALEFDPLGLHFRMTAPLIEERLVPSY